MRCQADLAQPVEKITVLFWRKMAQMLSCRQPSSNPTNHRREQN